MHSFMKGELATSIAGQLEKDGVVSDEKGKDRPVIVVEVEGGCVQETFSSHPVRIICVDRDVDGAAKKYLTHLKTGDAVVSDRDTDPTEGDLDVISEVLEEINGHN